MTIERVFARYCPEVDMADRWPEWRVIELPHMLKGFGEWFDVNDRVIMVKAGMYPRNWTRAHVLAHLDLGHHITAGRGFTAQMETDADGLAGIRLDLLEWRPDDVIEPTDDWEWDDIPMDGEPTKRL